MKTTIFPSKYKNKNSIVVESEKLRAEFLPNPGGKMVSLINKGTGYEILLQRNNEPRSTDTYLDQSFDGVYTDGECSGYDDMFPTIDVCNYESEPWKGIKMADHGEVWSLPWEHKMNTNSLHMSVHGVRFPYQLEKSISFIKEDTIKIDFTLTNNSPFDFEFLWAGHLMINLEEGTKVLVPDDCKQMTTILSIGKRKFGDIHNWPYLNDTDGNSYRADIARPAEVKGFEKYYFLNKLKDGWCELKYPDNKNKLKLSFPTDTVPYLGLLMNEKGWDDMYQIIVEPCTILYDRPDVAKKYGQVSKVKANGKYKWYLELSV
jgi:hypothetical protein